MNASPEAAELSSRASTAPRTIRIWLTRSVIVALTLVITFYGLELLLERYYSEGQSWNMTAFHPVRGWALQPGDYWVKPLRELNRIGIHINELGLRGPSEAARAPAAENVVILGDSFVVSRDIEFSESFPERLEQLLNAKASGGVEVLNAGVPGYGTAQELLLVRELYERRKARPNVFLLMFFTNDILDNLCRSYGDLTFQPVRPCFTLDRDGKPALTHLPENIKDYQDESLVTARKADSKTFSIADSNAFSIARAWTEEWLQTKGEVVGALSHMGIAPNVPRMPGLMNSWYLNEVVEKGGPLTSALIAQMAAEVRDRGDELIVSMIPSPFQIYPETYIPMLQNSFPGNIAVTRFKEDVFRPQRLVKEMCDKAGVPFQDLAPILAERRDSPLFVPRDGHLTHVGHRIASEALLPFVLEHLAQNASRTDSSKQVYR